MWLRLFKNIISIRMAATDTMKVPCSRKPLNKEQEELIMECFIVNSPIGGAKDGVMEEGKAAAMYERAMLDYHERVAPLIAQYEQHNSTCAKDHRKKYKPSHLVDVKCIESLWKRWMNRYKAVKVQYQVTSDMKKRSDRTFM